MAQAGAPATGGGAPGASEGPGFRPLYAQVKELMLKRLVGGEWRPGDLLPSEFRLAAELCVSQGTVRKALDELAAENLVVRRQGRGTFVAAHDAQRELFRFFRLVDERGERPAPTSRLLSIRRERAGASAAAARLGLAPEARVIRIERVRSLADRPAIAERIVVPEALFPGLGGPPRHEVPNALYELYQRAYGVTVGRAAERLRAVPASPREAELLGLAAGAPLLEIERIARALDGRPVEWRVSRCDTRHHAYVNELS